jgi:hypothetical protein
MALRDSTTGGNASVISADIALRLSGTLRVSVAMCPSRVRRTGSDILGRDYRAFQDGAKRLLLTGRRRGGSRRKDFG